MRPEIEKRLHRVMISASSTHNIRCNYASKCEKAQSCERCNVFFLKCSFNRMLALNFKEFKY